MGDKKSGSVDGLWGAARQRVILAMSPINWPRVVRTDEPIGNLNAANALGVVNLRLEVCRQNTHSRVLITHNHKLAELIDETFFSVELQAFSPMGGRGKIDTLESKRKEHARQRNPGPMAERCAKKASTHAECPLLSPRPSKRQFYFPKRFLSYELHECEFHTRPFPCDYSFWLCP
jgi:ABC-type glutathione transport system ATPase component